MRAEARLLVDDLADAGEEPGVVAGDGVDLVVGEAVAHRLGGEAQAVGGLGRERRGRWWRVASGPSAPGISISSKPVRPVSSEQRAFWSDSVEAAADRHGLADRLHRGGEEGLGAGELLEGEARDLGDDVVDGRLEARPA